MGVRADTIGRACADVGSRVNRAVTTATKYFWRVLFELGSAVFRNAAVLFLETRRKRASRSTAASECTMILFSKTELDSANLM